MSVFSEVGRALSLVRSNQTSPAEHAPPPSQSFDAATPPPAPAARPASNPGPLSLHEPKHGEIYTFAPRLAADPHIVAPGDPNKEQKRRAAEEAAKYDHYERIIERNGGSVDEAPDQRNLLAIRRPTDTNANGGKGQYDDLAVVIWKDEQGNKHVREYRANTEPTAQYQDNSDHTRDVNGDGRGELGRLPAGHYELEANWSFRKWVTTCDGDTYGMLEGADVQAEYDVNRDGRFDEGVTGDGGETMLWHQGDDDNVNSAGCQTMPPDDYRAFQEALGDDTNFSYTLVEEDVASGDVEAPHIPYDSGGYV